MRNDNLKPKDIFWNTLGTVTYAAISLLISVVVINLQGKIEGGIFSFGYSTLAHLVFIVAFFGIRPLHIVDIKYRYGFNDYKNFGIKAALLSIVLGLIYIGYNYYSGTYTVTKTMLLFVLIVHGALDGFSDYYECEYQRVNKLYMCGQALFFRIITFTIVLIGMLFVTQNLLQSEIVALIAEVVAFYILDVWRSKGVYKKAYDDKSKNKNLFLEALPLFLVVFLDMYIFSATKFSIDLNIGDAYSGFFNLIFMPTNIVYLVMSLFMKPILTPLSNAYFDDKKQYNMLLVKTVFFALGLCIVVMIGTLLFGNIYISLIDMVTENIYKEYLPYAKRILIILMLGGCFYTINTPLYFSLIIEKKQKWLLIAYAVVCIVSIYVAHLFVINLGIMGAALGFLCNMFLLSLGVFIAKLLSL